MNHARGAAKKLIQRDFHFQMRELQFWANKMLYLLKAREKKLIVLSGSETSGGLNHWI